MKTFLGIDLGGTNCRVAKVSEDGTILKEAITDSQAHSGAQAIVDNLLATIDQIGDLSDVAGIGVGVPGPVDTKAKVMLMATNLPGLENYPLAAAIEKKTNLPTYIDNDANVAGLAEALLGAGANYSNVYYVTHSTGIGGACILNGQVVSGKHGHAGEVGNLIIDRNRDKVNHLNVGAIENEASGTALAKKAQAFDPSINDAKTLFEAAANGNKQALALIDTMAYDMATMFSYIAHIIDPEVFVIGGGVSKASDQYFDLMINYYKNLVHKGMRTVEFKKAQLKEPGIIGAAMLPKSFGK